MIVCIFVAGLKKTVIPLPDFESGVLIRKTDSAAVLILI